VEFNSFYFYALIFKFSLYSDVLSNNMLSKNQPVVGKNPLFQITLSAGRKATVLAKKPLTAAGLTEPAETMNVW